MGCVRKDGFAGVGRALRLRTPRHLADKVCGTFSWLGHLLSSDLPPILLFLMLRR